MVLKKNFRKVICSFSIVSLLLTGIPQGSLHDSLCLKASSTYIDVFAADALTKSINITPLEKSTTASKWNLYKNSFSGNPVVEAPSLSNPYSIGKQAPGYIKNFLDITNFGRYLAGIPDDLEVTQEMTDSAMYGAVLLAAHGTLTHTPPKPADMSDEFYNKGYTATSTSNIFYSYGYLMSPTESIKGFLADNQSNNISTLGHRRWILNPKMKYTGFGSVDKGTNTRFGVMRAIDQSRSPAFDYDVIAWPNSGYFPIEMMASNIPWSITLNPLKYSRTNISSIKVTMTRKSDGKAWNLDSTYTDTSSDFFTVNTSGYGVPFCVIFKPVNTYKSGDEFDIHLSGIYTTNSEPVELNYSVKLYSLNDTAPTSTPTKKPTNTSTPTKIPTPTSTPTKKTTTPPTSTPTKISTPTTTYTRIPSPTITTKPTSRPTYQITGYVCPDFSYSIDSADEILSSFRINIDEKTTQIFTSNDGHFEITSIDPNTSYTLSISKPGYLTRNIGKITITDRNIILSTKENPLLLWAGDIPVDGLQDGVINMFDVICLAKSFNCQSTDTNYNEYTDLNCDGSVNMADVIIIAKHFNSVSADY